jgi:hypothetical protein
MIAHLLAPFVVNEKEAISINVIIPFETLDLSIVLDNSNGGRKVCFRDDIRIYCRKSEGRVDLTKEILGVSAQYGTDTLKFVEIINKVAKADLVRNLPNNDLPQRIQSFLDKYAVLNPNKEDDLDAKYTSPDAHQIQSAAILLSNGIIPSRCFSEWSSGGYKPYSSKEGREEHDSLVKEVYSIINKQ